MPKVLNVPDNDIFNRIQNSVLSNEMKEWLYETYQNSPTLGGVIVSTIEATWLAINRRVLREELRFPWSWEGYSISDITIVEKSIPNSLKEYLSSLGYNDYFRFPELYEKGLAITLKFTRMVTDVLSDETEVVSTFFVSDVYIISTNGAYNYYRCMSPLR